MFVSATVDVDTSQAQVVIPKLALQTVEGNTVVFVNTKEGFEPRPVAIGLSDDERVEITSGLNLGDLYVSTNAFTLKAQMEKGHYGHGHAH